MPHIKFSSTVWDGCSEIHLSKLNSLHLPRSEIVKSRQKQTLSTDEKQKALSILPLQRQLDFNKALLMFKANRRMVPSYITSLFSECSNRTIRYILTKPSIDLYKTSLAFSGPSVWNTLPVAIKTVGTIGRFKSDLNKYLMTD